MAYKLVAVAFVLNKLVTEAPIACKLVVNKLVVVASVKTPDAGVIFPITVPLIAPPLIAALLLIKLANVALFANKFVEVVLVPDAFNQVREVDETVPALNEPKSPVVATNNVPEAVLNDNQPVVVTLVKTPVEGVTSPIAVLLIDPPVITAFEAFKLVTAKFTPVADSKPNN